MACNGLLLFSTEGRLPVSFNVLRPILHVAQPLRPVLHQKLLDQVLGHGVNVTGPVYLAAEDLLVDSEWIVVKERRISSQHLVHEYAQGPPVNRLVMALRGKGLVMTSNSCDLSIPWTGWVAVRDTEVSRTASRSGQ